MRVKIGSSVVSVVTGAALAAVAGTLSACALGDDGSCRGAVCAGPDAGFPIPDATCPDADGPVPPPDGSAGNPDAGNSGDSDASPDAMTPDASVPPDGPVAADDCDPDPPIFPGADEITDGLDNDCDGIVDELEVCDTGAPYTTIAAAVAAAPSGAILQICPGVYHERLTIDTKSLRLVGDGAAPSSVVIDADQLGTALVINGAPAPGVSLANLTIRNGKTAGNGGAIRCTSATLYLGDTSIENNQAAEGAGMFSNGCQVYIKRSVFSGNQAQTRGGALSVRAGTGVLEDSTITGNSAGREGGGVASLNADFRVCRNDVTMNQAGLQGGGIHYRGSGVIEDNVVSSNTSGWIGGGIYVDQLAPTLRRNEVLANSSENDGGGIYLNQSAAIIEANRFAGNHSGDDGGGLRLFECDATLRDNLIAGNIADGDGGGIRVSHVASLFVDNTIVDNEAQGSGGGIDMDNDASTVRGGLIARNQAGAGGGVHMWLFPWLGGTIDGVVFEANEAWRGGALHVRHNFQPVTLRNLTVRNNVAGYGAGLFLRTTQFTLTNSVFAGNWASHEGAAISVGRDGSAYHEDECPPCPPSYASGSIEFVVAYDNEADEGGSAVWLKSPDLRVSSSIFADNLAPAVMIDLEDTAPTEPTDPTEPPPPPPPNPPVWSYNDTYPASFAGIADPTGLNGNISSDPTFTDPAAGDFRLAGGSVCIDAGDPSYLDLDSSRADMGALGGLGGKAP